MVDKIKSKFASIPKVALVALAIFGLMAGTAVASMTIVSSDTTTGDVREPVSGNWQKKFDNGPYVPGEKVEAEYDITNDGDVPQYVAVKVKDHSDSNLDDDSNWWINNGKGKNCGTQDLGGWMIVKMSAHSKADVKINADIPGDFDDAEDIGLKMRVERVDDEYGDGEFPKCDGRASL